MAISVSDYIFLATLGFTLAAPLGPVNMEMIKRGVANSKGYIFAFITGVGAMTGDFLVAMSVLLIGAEIFVKLLEIRAVLFFLFIANTAILTKIGLSAFRMEISTEFLAENVNSELGNELAPKKLVRQYGVGFVLVTTSPWSYLFWASFGPVVFTSGIPLDSFLDKITVTMMFLTGILTWLFVIGITLKISQTLASEKTLRFITKGSASLILIFAASVFIDAIWILFHDKPLLLINRFFDLFS